MTLAKGLREQRQMQWGSPTDPMRERVNQLHERDRMTVRGIENLARVSRFGSGEQCRGSIELVEMVLQRLAWTGPVRTAETKGDAISAQIGALPACAERIARRVPASAVRE
jgi:hypothetical protein